MTVVNMIRLEPMAEALIHEFVQSSVESFAQDQVRVGNWARSEVAQKREELLGELLPNGPSTEGHVFWQIVEDRTGHTVGRIWFSERDGGQETVGFVCNLVVDEPYRGRGYGKAAMIRLEQRAAAMGLGLICLDVFAENRIARKLYGGLGYQVMQTYSSSDGERVTGFLMAKGIETQV